MHTPETAPSPSPLRRRLGVPLGNFIPNSNGEGGRVISSGDSGGNG